MASILYRAAPIDPALKPGSPPHRSSELSRFESPNADTPASQSTDTDLPKSFSPVLPDLSGIGKYNGSEYRESFPGSVSVSASLPGLAALASVASAPTSNLRYVCERRKTIPTWTSLYKVLAILRMNTFPLASCIPLLFSAGKDPMGASEMGANRLADRFPFQRV